MIPEIVAVGCTLATLRTDVGFDEASWVERLALEVAAPDGCTLRLVLPAGVELTDWSGRVRPDDGFPYRLDAARLRRARVDRDGTRVYELLLPELVAGDVARVELERTWNAPVDLVWTPGADQVGFAELHLHREGDVVTAAGVHQDGRTLWTDHPDALTRVVLRHPWAPRTPPGLPLTTPRDLGAEAALARAAGLVVVPEAAFGRSPPVGDDALALGATDDRGFGRTVVALASAGPDHVELGQWSPDPGAPPGPGAPEAALWLGDRPVVLAPAGGALPRTGTWHTPDGPVAVGDARVVEAPVPGAAWWPDGVDVELHLAFDVAGRDPLRHLGSDDDLTYTARWTVSWAARAEPVLGFLPLPEGTLAVQQPLEPDCSRLHAGPDALWFVGAPGTTSCTFSVVLPLDDAWGELPAAPPHAVVSAHASWTRPSGAVTRGDVRIEDGTWRLVSLAGDRLLADRAALERELDDRFLRVALPEPALARRLRAGLTGWGLAAELRPLIAERDVVASLDVPPDRPRDLLEARDARVLTPGEAAMVGALYLRQARIDARWGLAEPVDRVRVALAPVAHTEGVIRVEHEGRGAWIDVACGACAAFEVRPSLVGADVLGPAPDRIEAYPLVDGLPRGIALAGDVWTLQGTLPPYGVGVTTLDLVERGLPPTGAERLELRGAHALALRLLLTDTPPGERLAFLARLLGAHAPELTVEGTAEAGAPVTLRAQALEIPALVRDTAGLVEVRTLATGEPPVICEPPGAAWAFRSLDAGGERVTQELRRRPLDADEEAALAACRDRAP